MTLNIALQQELRDIAEGQIKFNEPMSEHTTIKIGGLADVWFEPSNLNALSKVVVWADEHDIPRVIFGNGSNTLVRDGGFKGLIISLARFDKIEPLESEPAVIKVGAGVNLQHFIGWSVERSLSGLESLAGIPGTVGGALIMNAGTANGSIGDVVKSITVLNKGKASEYNKDRLEFGYRKLKLNKGVIIVEATLELKSGERTEIESKINKIRQKRKDTQPLLWPSLGSVFKNPVGGRPAWELIDECNLRNVRVGGARVSNEHSNWIVNEDNATAKDVEVLIRMIKEKVKDKTDVSLETEIIIMGDNI